MAWRRGYIAREFPHPADAFDAALIQAEMIIALHSAEKTPAEICAMIKKLRSDVPPTEA